MCKNYSTEMWYERICSGCNDSTISCCFLCWNNDILTDIGKYCSSCYNWYCAKCCNTLSINDPLKINDKRYLNDKRFGYLKCSCGYCQLCYREFDVSITPITYQYHLNNEYTQRKK